MAISQNLGTLVTAMLPALFATVAPPGAHDIPLIVGSITLAATVLAALSAWSARETHRVPLHQLGVPGAKAKATAHAVPIDVSRRAHG
jgi:hypothetical protein